MQGDLSSEIDGFDSDYLRASRLQLNNPTIHAL